MEKIFNSINSSLYSGISMKGKYIYMKRIKKDSTDHHIFRIDAIVSNDEYIMYKSDRSYILNVPMSVLKNSTLHDHVNVIELSKTDKLYEMSQDEFLATFKLFIQSDGQPPKSILI